MPQESLRPVTVRLPEEYHAFLRIVSAEEQQSMGKWTEKIVLDALAKRRSENENPILNAAQAILE
jgi:hypothetical protein